MSRKALGRGLNALFNQTGPVVQDMVELGTDQIDPMESQPRQAFSREKLQELADSIKANGLIQPIIVRRAGERFQIIAGERRWRAAQMAAIHRVSCIIKEVPDENVLEMSLIENLQREDLNPIEEAAAYRRLIDKSEMTQDEIASRIGKDRSSIANALRLLKLPQEIQAMVEQDQLSMGHARALLSIDSSRLQKELAAQIVERGLSVREVEKLVKRVAGDGEGKGAGRKPAQPATNPNIVAAEVKLSKKLGAPVKIKMQKAGGFIEIKFSSADDLTRLFDVLIQRSNH